MPNNNTILPNFLVIGAGKSGTTSLDKYLGEHPEIFMCPVKEPNFFAYNKHHVEDFDLPEDIYHYNQSVTDLSAYLELFKSAQNFNVRGEVSNTTFYGKHSIETIKKHVPNAKLIVILRQPAERLYSRYLHLAREDALPTEDFKDIFNRDSIWWQRPDLIMEGFYYKHLQPFYSNFPNKNIKVLFYEDLKYHKENLLIEIFNFLNVDTAFRPSNAHVVFNQSGHIKNKTIHKLIGANGLLIKPIKKITPSLINQLKKVSFINHSLIKLRSKNLNRPDLDHNLKIQITNEIYKADILQLEQLIHKDLSHWYT